MGSLLATGESGTKMKLPEIDQADVLQLENWIDDMDSSLEPMTSFVLPGGHSTISHTHIARCICRRAERIVVALEPSNAKDAIAIQYLNRLSDYLFVLSRKFSKDLNCVEQPWEPKM